MTPPPQQDPRIKQVDPGLALPQNDITIVAPTDGDGMTAALSANLAAIDPTWRERGFDVGEFVEWPTEPVTARDNDGVAALMKVSEGTIGYLDYAIAKGAGLPVALLQNRTGAFIAPNEAAGRQALAEAAPKTAGGLDLVIIDPTGAGAYPIVAFSWLLLQRQYTDPGNRGAILDFVVWGISSGQLLAGKLGYIPLPDQVVASGTRALEGIGP